MDIYKYDLNIIMYNIRINKSTGCWEYKRKLNNEGYGNIRYKGKPWLIHRLSYIFFKGEIKPKMFICHTCDNPRCCNPDHLFQGTAKTNLEDMYNKGRGFWQKSEEKRKIRRKEIKKEKTNRRFIYA